MPLGTGNDLSLTFGWGNAFLDAWIKVACLALRLLCTAATALTGSSAALIHAQGLIAQGAAHDAEVTQVEWGRCQGCGCLWSWTYACAPDICRCRKGALPW